ncbi:MAG TPA: folate family ECF transporter S component [Candidatus Limnocylindria bacterium]|nr:folate family ECF transporter S component [Candidatus Limnocylindria bacterium]
MAQDTTHQDRFSVKTVVILALLAAMSIVLENFLGVNTGQIKIHFGYLPIALAGMLYGVLPAVLVAVVADILSNLSNFNILFVLLAAMEGAVYGWFLHRRGGTINRQTLMAVLCQLVISVVIHAGLNTLLLWQLYGLFTPARFVINAISFPVKVLTLIILQRYRPAFEKYA